jgi:isopenicillin-N epimerase
MDPIRLHVNHGSFGGVPNVTLRAQQDLRRVMEGNPNAWFSRLPELVGQARHQVSSFLGVDPERLALVPNASAGATVAYSSLRGFAGMEVVVTDHTYGAVLFGAERFAQRWGGSVKIVPVPLDAVADDVLDRVSRELSDRTALVVIDHITSATAREMPVAGIIERAHSRGIPVLVDGAHAPGVLERPLVDVAPDFWIGNLHKFACAPRGTAAIVASESRAQQLSPLIDSWGMPYPFPERFDYQGTVDQTSYLSAHISFESIETRFGWHRVRAHAAAVVAYGYDVVTEAFAERGFDAQVDVGMPTAQMRLIRLPGTLGSTPEGGATVRWHLSDVAKAETAIPSWNGEGFLRISAHAYNTATDYEHLAERVVPLLLELSTKKPHD